MNAIRVHKPGFQSTVQDLGRPGYAHLGISASGAADALSLRAGNLLVGNAENAAGIEMTLIGGEFEFTAETVVALTGSDFDSGLPLWTPLRVRAGECLRFGRTKGGARGYLCMRGGVAVPRTLGSASVHLLTGVGGSALKAGDMLPIGDGAVRNPRGRGPAGSPPAWERESVLRVTEGPQASWFGDELCSSAWEITEESNRMGLRLRGPAMAAPSGNMITEGVSLGTVQVPPGGQPIILFVEHQTTGGYPKPANVISADFWRLGQARPRDRVRFETVPMARALDLLQQQEKWLYALV